MKCSFLIMDQSKADDAVAFFQSIGIKHFKSDDLVTIKAEPTIDIEFHEIPQVIDFYTIDNELSISNINAMGITFYLPIPPCSFISTEKGNLDGFVFCSMTNIKTINTLGELRLGWKDSDD